MSRARLEPMQFLRAAFWVIALSTADIASAEMATPGGEWEGFNNSLDGKRFSPLAQINQHNAAHLKVVCRVEIARGGTFQTGPVMVGGAMFVTTPTDTFALDPTTCAIKWHHIYRRRQESPWRVNRGVAYFGGRVYRGTDDGRLLALDAKTGAEVWVDVVGDSQKGELVTGAPIAWNGLVIVATALGEYGIRGRVMAFDAMTGREAWRFNTIPTGDEVGADSWISTASSQHGGGGSWSTFSIDAASGEVFVPVGNPEPAFARSERPGKNLFTNCVVVLDARTGTLKWWYQLTSDDPLDHDLGAAPMLFRNSAERDVVAAGSKDGYIYLIDTTSHELIAKTAITTVDPLPVQPVPEGTRACPGALGGVEWNGPAFDRITRSIFVGAVDYCSVYKLIPGTHFKTGVADLGGSWRPSTDVPTGWITAIDSDTGSVRWRFHAPAPVLSGLTPTAGGVLFAGDNAGNFYVFDKGTGDILKKIDVGGAIAGGVITYEQNLSQYVALTAGNTSQTSFGAAGRPSMVILSLDSGIAGKSDSHEDSFTRGQQLFHGSCAVCHGSDGKTIDGFDLSTVHERMTEEQLIAWIKNPAPPMPKVFVEPIDHAEEADIRAIAAFLGNWRWIMSNERDRER